MLRAKAGSDVLCVHKDASNEFGRLPLLVTRTFGAGKVLFMGTDGAWRWRKGVEDKYHYRFWGQVVRWMAYQRNMAKGETMRLYYVPDQPQAEPDAGAARQRDGAERRAASWRRGDRADHGPVGQVRAGAVQLGRRRMGRIHRAIHGRSRRAATGCTLFCKQTGATLEASFFVQGAAAEQVGRPARPEVMEELARVTGARSSRPASWRKWCGRWPSFPTRRPWCAGAALVPSR